MFAVPRSMQDPPANMAALDAKGAAAAAPAAGARDHGAAASVVAQSEADKLSAALAPPPPTPGSDQLPEFDVVRVEPNGEAVIAGRAAPGATVELLRNGEPHDRVVADQSGQFAMIPRALPPGNYDLTLRARQDDGREVVSRQSVAVAVNPTPSERPVVALMSPNKPPRLPSTPQTSEPAAGNAVVEATGALPTLSPASSQAEVPVASQPRLAAANAALVRDKPSPSSVVAPKITTTTVSRGDSLWRISRRALGAGPRYVGIYRANKAQIHNPNLIYPGQVFVMPTR
ncbi:LysM peptidoglycan-binding domain-containing protein [Bradyrhizobium sp. ISRA443]|uniref:LysM peptidoglycan-binding domain-containing protein n=2 Tax=Bradyrhizobium TaxID=374 RepID=UPI002479D2DC|nr:LysM peptidoglycan-binding domain-containing protein [Bradyrhizobium sp. ISRA443]WGS16711.1 LysM peptidoglycan-binding domain-containing protein [Bradyrhizobium sp. ISRA443]